MWVRFEIKGGRGHERTEETYVFLEDDDPWSDENLRAEAEDWASRTSLGTVAERYKYGFERVKKLPERVRLMLIEKYEDMRKTADRMLRILKAS